MLTRLAFSSVFLLFVAGLQAQGCIHRDLSSIFDFEILITRKNKDAVSSATITVLVRKKAHKTSSQSIQVNSYFLFANAFATCNTVRSYSTGKNKKARAYDNDYGDFIVADLNFDSREDIAVKKDSGGSGGPIYEYFLQDQAGKFVRNHFLSAEMEYFPTTINKHKKLLITYIHAGACGLGEHIYSFNAASSAWTQQSHRIINICDDELP